MVHEHDHQRLFQLAKERVENHYEHRQLSPAGRLADSGETLRADNGPHNGWPL